MIINIYGLIIKCHAESTDLVSEITRSFKYFVTDDGNPSVNIFVKEKDPPYETFPSIKANFSTPRNIVYKDKDCKIIDYFGKGVIVEEDKKLTYNMYSRDKNFLIEAFYLLILSLLGQFCDKNGMLRVHALALSYHNKAILLSVPPGGGKSTMALAMLQEKDIKLISDDAPIIDRSGRILPFPLRIGILDENIIKSIPDEYVYKMDRMEFGPKCFIDCDYWKDKIEDRYINPKDSILFISCRILNENPSIRKISKRKVFAALIRDAVIGIGLYQGLEFIFQSSSWEVFFKVRIVFRRLIKAFRLTLLSKTYQITLSRDITKNALIFKEFIRNLP